jgi:hypothetical protein
MKGISAFALFCEDIRREGSGRDTIIGTTGGTLRVPSFPGGLRRLALYVRISFDADGEYTKPVWVDVELSNGEVERQDNKPVPAEMIARSVARAKEKGDPFGTIISRMRLEEPVQFNEPTRISAVLHCGDERKVIGFFKVDLALPTSPTSSQLPSEQSRPDAPQS